MPRQTHCQKILEYCKVHGFITQREAAAVLDCYRLPARIMDLESAGHVFDHDMVYYKDGNGVSKKYMKYRLVA